MWWQIWQQSQPQVQALTGKVKYALASQLKLDSQAVGEWRLLEKSGRHASKRVKLIRIFDPALIGGDQMANLKYDDLEMTDHRKALLFNGHIEANGQIHVTHSA